MNTRDELILKAGDGLDVLFEHVHTTIDLYVEVARNSKAVQPILMSEVWHAAGVCYGKQNRATAAIKLRGAYLPDQDPAPTADLIEVTMMQINRPIALDSYTRILSGALLRDFAAYAIAFYEALFAITNGDKLAFLDGYRRISEYVHSSFNRFSTQRITTQRIKTRETVRVQIG